LFIGRTKDLNLPSRHIQPLRRHRWHLVQGDQS
jgi:hypothetical protein